MSFTFKLRYYVSKYLIWAGLTAMPECEYKQELLRRVYGLKEEATQQAQTKEQP